MRLFRVLVVTVVPIALAVGGAWLYARHLYEAPGPLTEEKTVVIAPGTGFKGIARVLAKEGVIGQPIIYMTMVLMEQQQAAFKAGEYAFPPGISPHDVTEKLTQGDVTQTSITIVEGWTVRDLKQALRADGDVAKAAVDLADAELMRAIGASGQQPEGWFFPDTYFFASGATDLSILTRAYRTMQQRLDVAWVGRAPGLPFDAPYQALILASIVEKETGRVADRPLIASVLVNRLQQGMRLQADPTVIYGIGERFDGNLTKRDLDADSAYNTYTRDGLPPTPIALPSQASLDAVLHPPATPYLYFVSRGDGSSEFSANLADHNRAVAKYQKNGR